MHQYRSTSPPFRMRGEAVNVLPRIVRPPGREDESQNADRLVQEVRRVEVRDLGPGQGQL